MLHRTKASGRQIRESYQGRRNAPGRGHGRAGYGLTRTLAIAALALLLPLGAAAAATDDAAVKKPSPWSLCAKATNLIERQEGIPRQLLRAISKVESGRFHAKKQIVMAWPWTVMAEGRGRYLPTKTAAIAEVEGLRARGVRNIDVGCMQVNLYYHPDAFADLNQAFDPVANVAYAASYLKALKIEQGSWAKAVAHYHSADPGRYRQYRLKVHVAWRLERAKYLAAMSKLQATQFAALEPPPVIMTWHQANVAEPFGTQLASLDFAAAPFDSGIDGPAAPSEMVAALAYDGPAEIETQEPGGQRSPQIVISGPDPATPSILIAAREAVEFNPQLSLVGATGWQHAGPLPLVAQISIPAWHPSRLGEASFGPSTWLRQPAEFGPSVRRQTYTAASAPIGDSRFQLAQLTVAAREPGFSAEPVSPAAALPFAFGAAYPGFVRAEPIRPGERWSLVWPLLEPHAERVGRGFIGFLQSFPSDSGDNG
jgi:Transglycosylase SLT domain